LLRYAKALPLELFRREQERIGTAIDELRGDVDGEIEPLEYARDAAKRAMNFLRDCRKAYREAQPEERRRWNEVLFKRISIGEGRIQGYEYREPFPTLLAWAGSNKGSLVSRPGFEPGTKGLKVPCSSVELAARMGPQV
jgi:hypothetical protein